MNSASRPTTIRVYDSSLAGPPAAPFKPYEYNGTDRLKPKPAPVPGAPVCGADDCEALPHAKGYCDLHYRRVKAYGTPYVPDRRTKEHRSARYSS